LESALGDAKEMAEQQKPLTALLQAERDVLQGHVAALTKELEERHTCRRGELDAVEERYKGLAEERDAAKSTVDFMAERQRQCEEEVNVVKRASLLILCIRGDASRLYCAGRGHFPTVV
jgi:hypothetical protein